MALKIIHLLAVTAVSLTIYGYASYYSSPSLLRPITTPTLIDKSSNASAFPDIQEWKQPFGNSAVANTSSVGIIQASLATVTTSPLISASSKISPTPQSSSVKPSPPDPNKGVKTRMFYVAGHQLPRPEVCPDIGDHLKLLTVIMSAPSHSGPRMAIRQTWGHYAGRSDVAIVFLIGETGDEKLNAALNTEGDLYMDIIRGRFMDSYNNLTLKTVSMMEWVSDYCPKAKFVLKTDDDMFINVPKLLTFIDKHTKDNRTIFGRLAKRWKPIRNSKSKYFVSRSQYRPPLFPDFTTGPAYLFPASLALGLYKNSLDQTYLKLEDVFMTGIVAQKLKIKRSHAAEFLNKRVPMNACTVQRVISIHMVKFSEQFDLWMKLLDGKTKCK